MMLTHIEQKTLPYTPEQMFDLVAAVDKYRDFLPWCVASRIRGWESDTVFHADLVIGYKMFREKFSSRVVMEPPLDGQDGRITIDYMDGPLQSLQNQWRFIAKSDGGCTIDFSVEFSFKNKMFQGLVEVFFEQVVKRMVDAFEKRAVALYGDSPSKPV